MRIALLSDIHANAVALEAVLDEIDRLHIDSIVCLGDVATIGPSPTETLAMLRESGCRCIRGNHDISMLDPGQSIALGVAAPLTASLHWAIGKLSDDDVAFLSTFEDEISIDLGPERMLCVHASPGSVIRGVTRLTPADTVESMFAGREESVFVCGHTHMQMLRPWRETIIVNPGSLGAPFSSESTMEALELQPWAEFAVVEADEYGIRCSFHRTHYSIEGARDAVAASDLPIADWWIGQYERR